MTERPLVLLPPSLTKASGGRRPTRPGLFDQQLATSRRSVREALYQRVATATAKELEVLLNARGALLREALDASLALGESPSRVTPAWRRYQGVVWSHLEAETLSTSLRRRLLIPSGLYGLVSGEDPIEDYRLAMGASLAPLGRLARFWKGELTQLLANYRPRAPLVNLLPAEHAASIDFDALSLGRRVFTVRFLSPEGDRAVGHDAKAVKGVLARRTLLEGVDSLDGVAWNGWTVRLEGSEVLVYAPRERAWGTARP
ncbi:MAG: hypothetical protein JWM55_989 [Acidimicrobiaceae bacterium]|nr:hypothetical protein [Acidimicrobiaceae bacterium]